MIYEFANTAGHPMMARLALRGDRYGRNGCLTAEAPLVEFYLQTEYEHNNPWLKELLDLRYHPYFITHYYLDTFLDSDNGLCLEGSMREYDLTAQECRKVVKALFAKLAGVEK